MAPCKYAISLICSRIKTQITKKWLKKPSKKLVKPTASSLTVKKGEYSTNTERLGCKTVEVAAPQVHRDSHAVTRAGSPQDRQMTFSDSSSGAETLSQISSTTMTTSLADPSTRWVVRNRTRNKVSQGNNSGALADSAMMMTSSAEVALGRWEDSEVRLCFSKCRWEAKGPVT